MVPTTTQQEHHRHPCIDIVDKSPVCFYDVNGRNTDSPCSRTMNNNKRILPRRGECNDQQQQEQFARSVSFLFRVVAFSGRDRASGTASSNGCDDGTDVGFTRATCPSTCLVRPRATHGTTTIRPATSGSDGEGSNPQSPSEFVTEGTPRRMCTAPTISWCCGSYGSSSAMMLDCYTRRIVPSPQIWGSRNFSWHHNSTISWCRLPPADRFRKTS